MDAAFESRVASEVKLALTDLINEGVITLESISLEKTPQRAFVVVSYVLVDTGDRDSVTIDAA